MDEFRRFHLTSEYKHFDNVLLKKPLRVCNGDCLLYLLVQVVIGQAHEVNNINSLEDDQVSIPLECVPLATIKKVYSRKEEI